MTSHTPQRAARPTISPLLLALTSMVGVGAFFAPFFLPPARVSEEGSHAGDAPVLLVALVGLCVAVLLADLETRRLDAKYIALLGMLVATNAALRPVQGLGGFSLLYILPILTGYTYGAGFGFLLGALSVLVSALYTGGVGVWLPFEMFGLAWIGLGSAGVARLGRGLRAGGWGERVLLAAWGFVVGLAYGALLNLYFWPFLDPAQTADPAQAWSPGDGLVGALQHYATFYLVTSFWYDLLRALGNAVLLLLLAAPLLRLLRRFQARFLFTVKREPET